MRNDLLRPLRTFVPAVLVFLAAACGGGGTGDSANAPSAPTPPPAPQTLTITTSTLPAGSVGSSYAATQLQASGVQGAATWSVDSGSLPDGLSLSANGMVSGTPTTTGAFAFVARIDDDVAMDTQDLMVSVDVLGVAITSGVTIGDAWSGRPVTFEASGHVGSVTYTPTDNQSGGSITQANPVAGTASWTPGPTAGAGIVDTLLANDTGSGKTYTIVLTVMPHPASGYVAAFGSSDVWYIDPSPKLGSHAYATDFHDALATAGFRDPGSTDATGTEADQLAALYIRIEVLRQLNPMFQRNADGTAGASGLPITFPLYEPGSGYSKASEASSLVGSPTRYSVMGFTRGSQSGVIGTAFLDNASNGWHENDTTSGSFELGVFANQIVPIVNSSYSNPLPNSPVGAGDVAALEALLYDLASPGGRYNTLRTQGRGLAKALAATIAHEIGHSLGLDHTNPPSAGSIMNPSAVIGPSATHAFTAEDIAQLQGALPGLGKSTGAQTAKFTSPGPRPLQVCRCRGHAAPRGR